MVFQNYALFPHMTWPTTSLMACAAPRPGAEIARRVADALALIKLSGWRSRKPRQLSGGQQQRVRWRAPW